MPFFYKNKFNSKIFEVEDYNSLGEALLYDIDTYEEKVAFIDDDYEEVFNCLGCGEYFNSKNINTIDGELICSKCEDEYYVYKDNI